MTTTIALMTLLMVIRLGLPNHQPTPVRTAVLLLLLTLGVLLCLEFNTSTLLLIVVWIATLVIAEHYLPDSWRYPVRVLSLLDCLLLVILFFILPWTTIAPREWLLELSALELKYLSLMMGGLLLAREGHWLQSALLSKQQIKPPTVGVSGVTERALMYAGLVVGLPYWWLLGVLAAKGVFIKTKDTTEIGLIWLSSLGSTLMVLLVFDLIRRGGLG